MKSLELVVRAQRRTLALLWLSFCLCRGLALAQPVDEPGSSSSSSSSDGSDGIDRIVYDQRQTGKYNIHVSIKDVAIIEMGQNELDDQTFNEEDYYYDDNDLTVKPIMLGLTTKPLPQTTRVTTSASSAPSTTHAPTTFSSTSPASSTSDEQPESTTSEPTTYSANLLTDVAATQAAALDSKTSTSAAPTADANAPLQPSSAATARRKPNRVVLDTSTHHYDSPSSTHLPTLSTRAVHAPAARSKEQPIMEPVLHPHQQHTPLKSPAMQQDEDVVAAQQLADLTRLIDDSKIYNFKAHRTQAKPPATLYGYPLPLGGGHVRRCRSNQYRDASGNCRIKRSSSILKKLLGMLVTMPFVNERSHHNAPDAQPLD